MRNTLTMLLAGSCLMAIALPAAAQEQAAEPAPAASPAASPADGANDRAAAISGQAPAGDLVVTGTRIVRPNNKSAAPIVTTSRAEIVAQGATVIEEVLNRLPQVQVNSEQNFSDSEGRQRIKLRSLGYERTLSLIDGLRFGLPNSLDVGIIPNALVERVDVLTGGASSVYGSDAISGVVNFIMRKNFEGVRLDANYSLYDHQNDENVVTAAARRANLNFRTGRVNDGGRADITLAAGANLFDDRVNLTSFINYRQSDAIQLSDRSSSACEILKSGRGAPLTCSLASFTGAGTIIPQTGPRAGQILVNDPRGSRTFVSINSGPGTAANPYDDFVYQRAFERVNTGGFLTAQISDRIEFYSSALFYRDKSENQVLTRTFNFGAYGETPYSVNCDNPFLSAAQATDLCGTSAGLAGAFAPIDLRYRFDQLPPTKQRSVNEGYRLVAGFRGRTADDTWSYDLAGMLSRSRIDVFEQAFVDFDRLNRSLDVVSVGGTARCRSAVNGIDPACVPFNAFVPNNNDPTVTDYLFNREPSRNSRIPRLFQALATVSGDLGKYGITSPLANQGVAVALGAEYRSELERQFANAFFRQQNGGQDIRVTQNILESNIEIQAPLVEDQPWTRLLQLNAGYRLSKYNRLEGKFDTWKLEGLWSPITGVTFRGSYNKAQRAADVTGAAAAANVQFFQGFYSDPCAPRIDPANPNGPRLAPSATLAQCRNTGLPDNLYGSAALICPNDQCTVRDGGFNLRPETAYTKTFGVVLQPAFIPGLTVSVDRWLIDLDDQLEFLQPQLLLNDCLLTGDDFFCRGVFRNPGTGTLSSAPASNPATGFVVRGSANGFRSQSHGWDFQGQYDVGIGNVGRLNLSYNGTLMTRVGGQASPTVAERNCVGYFGSSCGESLPRYAHQFWTTWTSPDRTTSLAVNWRHRGPMDLDVFAPASTGVPAAAPSEQWEEYRGIGAFNWFDVALSFAVTKQMTFRLTANNVFDREPPLVPNGRSRIGLLRSNTIMGYDPLGRQIVAGISLNL